MKKQTKETRNLSKMSRRMRSAYESLESAATTFAKAIEILKKAPQPKFDGAVEVTMKLKIDPTKSDQNVRGAALMPAGLGKTTTVAVFTQAQHAKDAESAGADHVITDETTAKEFIAGPLNVNVVIATPDMMPLMMKWGASKVLGPKGLMPNAKVGTVSTDVAAAVKAAKDGQAKFKNDKAGYLHTNIGKISFDAAKLQENFNSLLQAVQQAKPAAVKADFIQSVSVSATMCPAVLLLSSEIPNA